MRKTSFALLCAMLLLAGAADAQTPTRARGIVNTLDGNVLSVKSVDGKNIEVQLDEKTEFVFTQAIKLADIKQGDFLGVTSNKSSDGSLTGFEVRRFPKPVNPGHRPFEGQNDQTMTNATVATVMQSAKGRELTVTYDGGSQKIVIPENAPISMLVPGERSQLKPGAPVSLVATSADGGKFSAQRIQISPVQ